MAQRKSPRAQRRAAERAAEKLWRAKQRLAALEPGGSAERPLEIPSASVVEARASGEPCLRCGGQVRVADHRAELVAGQRLRIARVRCVRCGAERSFFFRLHVAEPS